MEGAGAVCLSLAPSPHAAGPEAAGDDDESGAVLLVGNELNEATNGVLTPPALMGTLDETVLQGYGCCCFGGIRAPTNCDEPNLEGALND